MDHGIHTDVSANLFEESKGAPAIVCTAKLSSAGVTNSSDLHGTLHNRALPSTSAVNLVVIESVKEDDNFASLSCSCLFHCGVENEVSSKPGNILPSGYYQRDTQKIIPQSLIHPHGKDVPPPANVESEFTESAAVLNDCISEITCTATWVTKFDAADYRQMNLLLRVNQINNPEVPLGDIFDARICLLAQPFCAY